MVVIWNGSIRFEAKTIRFKNWKQADAVAHYYYCDGTHYIRSRCCCCFYFIFFFIFLLSFNIAINNNRCVKCYKTITRVMQDSPSKYRIQLKTNKQINNNKKNLIFLFDFFFCFCVLYFVDRFSNDFHEKFQQQIINIFSLFTRPCWFLMCLIATNHLQFASFVLI